VKFVCRLATEVVGVVLIVGVVAAVVVVSTAETVLLSAKQIMQLI